MFHRGLISIEMVQKLIEYQNLSKITVTFIQRGLRFKKIILM